MVSAAGALLASPVVQVRPSRCLRGIELVEPNELGRPNEGIEQDFERLRHSIGPAVEQRHGRLGRRADRADDRAGYLEGGNSSPIVTFAGPIDVFVTRQLDGVANPFVVFPIAPGKSEEPPRR